MMSPAPSTQSNSSEPMEVELPAGNAVKVMVSASGGQVQSAWNRMSVAPSPPSSSSSPLLQPAPARIKLASETATKTNFLIFVSPLSMRSGCGWTGLRRHDDVEVAKVGELVAVAQGLVDRGGDGERVVVLVEDRDRHDVVAQRD